MNCLYEFVILCAGRRQQDLQQRARADEQYRQIYRVHSQAASTFVDLAVDLAVEQAATEVAQLAASNMDHDYDDGTGAHGVMAFLLPHVASEAQRRAQAIADTKYTLAAQHVIADVTTNACPDKEQLE